MLSKRELEGYVCIDHTESPGIDQHPLLGAGKKFEGGTYSCPYCQRQIIVNPLRTRDREYCMKLDRYICDQCGAKRKLGIEMKPFKQVMDDYLNGLAKGKLIIP